MFDQVEKTINMALLSKQGVALLVPHVDYHFMSYLGTTLLKNLRELSCFFVEASPSILSKNITILDRSFAQFPMLSEIKKIQVCTETTNFGHSFSTEADNNSVLFAALCAHIYGIKVVGIDEEPSEVDSIRTLPSNQFASRRIASNEVMVTNINKEKIQLGEKYIILIGPMHYGVAQKLKIETIAVIDNSYYERFCEIAPSSGIDFSSAIMDYKFTYSIDINVNLSTKDRLLPIRQDDTLESFPTSSSTAKKILFASDALQKKRNKPLPEEFNLTIHGVSKEDLLLKELDPEEVNQGEINITVTKQFIEKLRKTTPMQ